MSEFPEAWRARPVRENTIKSEQGICQDAGLLHPDDTPGKGRHIGSFVPASSRQMAVKFIEDWADRKVAEFQKAFAAGEYEHITFEQFPDTPPLEREGVGISWNLRDVFEYNFIPLSYPQYLRNLKEGHPKPLHNCTGWFNDKEPLFIDPHLPKFEKEQMRHLNRLMKRERKRYSFPIYRPGDERFIALRGGVNHPNPDGWTPDEKGYLAYVERIAPQAVEFLERPIPLCAGIKDFEHHSYITGTIGSGKTEVLKLLIYSAVKLENCGVLVIDPHGDMAGQIARWPEFAGGDRLVYIDPELEEGVTPRLNPFDVLGKGVSDVRQTRQFISALEEMLGDRDGAALSVYMKSTLTNCLRALFAMGDKGMWDLVEFMDKNRNIGLRQQAARILPPRDAAFFEGDFQKSQYDATRMSVAARVSEILNEGGALFDGPSSFDLVGLLNQKKVVVLNLAGCGSALGRFVLATVQAMALGRKGTAIDETARTPVHVFVDECQNYISDATTAILEEARKFKIFLTLAQQQVGQAMSGEKSRSILGNAHLKIVGPNEPASHKALAGAAKAKPEDLFSLSGHEFAYCAGNRKPVRFEGAAFLLDNAHAMSAGEWETVKTAQIAKYYVPIGGDNRPDGGANNPLSPASDGPPFGL